MLNNDPTKSEFYHRCPLFGDLQPIEEAIGDVRPDLSKCSMIVKEVRSWLIYPFLPHDPFLSSLYCHELNADYFNGEPYPDPEIVEKRIGYPASYLNAFRGIYGRLRGIESDCLNKFTRADEYPYGKGSAAYLSLDYDDNSAVIRALTINGNMAADIAKNTFGVEFKARQIINSTRMFFLFAHRNALDAIENDLVWGESRNYEQSRSKDLYQAALTYMKRADEIQKMEPDEGDREVWLKNNNQRLLRLEQAKKKESQTKSNEKTREWAGARGEPYRKRNAEYKRIAEIIIREKTKAHHKLFYPPPPKHGWKSYIIKKIAEELKDEKHAKRYEEDQNFIKKEKFQATENSIREIFKGKKRKNGIKTENMLDEIYKNIV